MRLTTRTSLAVHTLLYCASRPGCLVRKHEIAAFFSVSENHLAQVVHHLASLGYLMTKRGRLGGLQLGLQPEEISLSSVVRAMEPESGFTDSLEISAHTGAISTPIAAACNSALEAFYSQLEHITIRDLITSAPEQPSPELCAA